MLVASNDATKGCGHLSTRWHATSVCYTFAAELTAAAGLQKSASGHVTGIDTALSTFMGTQVDTWEHVSKWTSKHLPVLKT